MTKTNTIAAQPPGRDPYIEKMLDEIMAAFSIFRAPSEPDHGGAILHEWQEYRDKQRTTIRAYFCTIQEDAYQEGLKDGEASASEGDNGEREPPEQDDCRD